MYVIFIIEQSIFNCLVEQGSQPVISKFLFWQFSFDLPEGLDLSLKVPAFVYTWTCQVIYMLPLLLSSQGGSPGLMNLSLIHNSMTWARNGKRKLLGFRCSHRLGPYGLSNLRFFTKGTSILVSSCFHLTSTTYLHIQWKNAFLCSTSDSLYFTCISSNCSINCFLCFLFLSTVFNEGFNQCPPGRTW